MAAIKNELELSLRFQWREIKLAVTSHNFSARWKILILPFFRIILLLENQSIAWVVSSTLIKTTQPTSVPVQRPNSDLLLMPYYEWIIYLDHKLTIKFSLILSVVGPCSRNINWILLVYWTPGILPPYWNDAAACIFSQLNNTRIQIPCHEA